MPSIRAPPSRVDSTGVDFAHGFDAGSAKAGAASPGRKNSL
jgi:hypothetical protein